MTANSSSSVLYTAAQVRALDNAFIASGVPAAALMKRAGRSAFELLCERFDELSEITVFAGGGNNAGDGFVVAALAAARRLPVTVVLLGDPEKLGEAARAAYDYARQEGVIMMPPGPAPTRGVIVDSLLGIGVSGEVRPEYRKVIEQINSAGLPVLSLDMPSGLCADTGAELGVAVKADITITFIANKRGLFTGRGPALAGELLLDDLAAPADIYETVEAEVKRQSFANLRAALPARQADAHKGDFGHVMVIGGDVGRGGAAMMAAEAAARGGAGLVSLATRPEHVAAMLARQPEVMACGVISGQELEPWLVRPTVLVVGPGLGQSPWSEQMLQQALATDLPLVLDADALNLVAKGRLWPAGKKRDNWLLTPHPGEAARLLDCSTAEIQADRFASVQQLQLQYGGVALLKGAGTLVVGADRPINIIAAGNPGMASGGMGDVLSGLLGALLAQGLSSYDAANLGASVHAHAADLAAADGGQVSLLATDILAYVGELLGD
ncbi:bifunctional ADP-dependent NAD(P)H-hydrate dehydratase/NAD(P)H-hydrate epimerase [Gilvimarinus polysaccharolyticus]|uniref:bifunctional ADP-dependent NAD(P)H-hydrate dehydratase/NAD(P)H-hydrate epimerase n=1 Tax=Gilvimarinus polysaccharolyticus TaxID=863921 RepID=UPI00067366AC|nr:bifunctional ADP-dependent NAD(P)H-hydrate dehydratase/NAD(P)H-hydrate epimerase [Gilvimarinus polysaccharolyticus]